MSDTEFPKELIEESSEKKDEKLHESLYTQVLGMSVNEKIRLATFGNKEARNMLVKDQNRVVIQAVMNSPKLSEDEVVSQLIPKAFDLIRT